MNIFLLEPEVAGELGRDSILKKLCSGKTEVEFLHYEFSGWLGDDLLESTPCFIVSEQLANSLIKSDLTGYRLEEVEVTTNEEFDELYSDADLPSFRRLVPLGRVMVERTRFKEWSKHDFCLSEDSSLVVTKEALLTLQKHQLDFCTITALNEAR